jgi:homocitrate synthase
MRSATYAIVDSTLREGEQFESASFSTGDKVEIARALAGFGVEYIELTSPVASPRSRADCALIAGLGLKSRIVAHIRCNAEDARQAIDTGVAGISMVIGVSPILRAASHHLGIEEITARARLVAESIRKRAPGIELRFSTEDAFRCPPADLLAVFRPLKESGLFDRFGVADTTGRAMPLQVFDTVRMIAAETGGPIEFHGHNDTGCAIANACMALAAGASHINTTILGIGERNGIAALEGLVAALYAQDEAGTRARYDLRRLSALTELVARKLGIEIPFNHCIVGRTAFTHKAGIHTKAMLQDPHSYEALDPADFGRERTLLFSHLLVGHNAIGARARELGLELTPAEVRHVTESVKAQADDRTLSAQDVDRLLIAAAERRARA